MPIILPEDDQEQPEVENQKFESSQEDEEKFMLMYHMNFQPSEVDNLSEERRKWIVARFMAQKNMEHEMMEQQRIMSSLGPLTSR